MRNTQHFSYDPSGKLINRSLPTGQVLTYGYDKQQQHHTQSIQLQRAWLTRVAKFTSQRVAKSITNTLPESWSQQTLISVLSVCPLRLLDSFLAHFSTKLGLKCQEYPRI